MKKSLMSLCFILLCLSSITLGAPTEGDTSDTKNAANCGELGDCLSTTLNCHEKCGCDRFAAYHYNETTGKCVLRYKHLMIPKVNIYVEYDPIDAENEHDLSRAIQLEAEKIFKAILISGLIFISCCAVCVISACLYCFRINYADYRLKSDIKALAKKLKRNEPNKKERKKRTTPMQESCNIVCADADVFVM